MGKLDTALRKTGFKNELRREDPDDPIPAMLAVTDRFENRVDLLAGLRGMDPGAFGRAVSIPFKGTKLRLVARENFIAMKCFAGGSQDIIDAQQALRTNDEPVGLDLLRRTTHRFGRAAADMLERLLAT